jgi:hypothetical protein
VEATVGFGLRLIIINIFGNFCHDRRTNPVNTSAALLQQLVHPDPEDPTIVVAKASDANPCDLRRAIQSNGGFVVTLDGKDIPSLMSLMYALGDEFQLSRALFENVRWGHNWSALSDVMGNLFWISANDAIVLILTSMDLLLRDELDIEKEHLWTVLDGVGISNCRSYTTIEGNFRSVPFKVVALTSFEHDSNSISNANVRFVIIA